MTERILEMIAKAGAVLLAGGFVCLGIMMLACAIRAFWLLWGDMA